jgi:hypothetical protein
MYIVYDIIFLDKSSLLDHHKSNCRYLLFFSINLIISRSFGEPFRIPFNTIVLI